MSKRLAVLFCIMLNDLRRRGPLFTSTGDMQTEQTHGNAMHNTHAKHPHTSSSSCVSSPDSIIASTPRSPSPISCFTASSAASALPNLASNTCSRTSTGKFCVKEAVHTQGGLLFGWTKLSVNEPAVYTWVVGFISALASNESRAKPNSALQRMEQYEKVVGRAIKSRVMTLTEARCSAKSMTESFPPMTPNIYKGIQSYM